MFPLGCWPRQPPPPVSYTGTRGGQPAGWVAVPPRTYSVPTLPGGDTDTGWVIGLPPPPPPPTIRYEVIYPYDAQLHDELTIRPGDVITVEEGDNEEDSLWWMGIDEAGCKGFFYVIFAERLNEIYEDVIIESSISATSADMYSVSFEGISYFVEDQPGDELECIFCKNLPYNPHQSICCGHTMCYDCAHKWGERTDSCPQCRVSPFQVVVDTHTKRHIFSLTVYCTHYMSGCEWKGSFNTVRDHLSEDCPYEDVECENDRCAEWLQRRYLSEHMDEECSMRIVECPCCEDDDLSYHELVNAHYKECPGWPVRCPNHCNTESGKDLTRSTLQDHLRSNCPEQVVPCQFAEAGCTVRVKRVDMAHHIEQFVGEHMTAMMRLKKAHTELQADNRDLKEALDVSKGAHHSLMMDHDVLKKDHSALNRDLSMLRNAHTALANHYSALVTDYEKLKKDHEKLKANYYSLNSLLGKFTNVHLPSKK